MSGELRIALARLQSVPDPNKEEPLASFCSTVHAGARGQLQRRQLACAADHKARTPGSLRQELEQH